MFHSTNLIIVETVENPSMDKDVSGRQHERVLLVHVGHRQRPIFASKFEELKEKIKN